MASSTQLVTRSLIEAYDFGRFGTIVDVGGGNGSLLRALLAEYPGLRGVLFNQPHVVEGADLGERGSIAAGSFFESVPEGGDAYLLKWIIHDWEDEDAVEILRNVRRNPGTLLVVERTVDSPNEGPERSSAISTCSSGRVDRNAPARSSRLCSRRRAMSSRATRRPTAACMCSKARQPSAASVHSVGRLLLWPASSSSTAPSETAMTRGPRVSRPS
jgi:hypothetical protein